jgi:hypothetical protein
MAPVAKIAGGKHYISFKTTTATTPPKPIY